MLLCGDEEVLDEVLFCAEQVNKNSVQVAVPTLVAHGYLFGVANAFLCG
jgi:hypothetical protein